MSLSLLALIVIMLCAARLAHRLKLMMSLTVRHNLELVDALRDAIEDMPYGDTREEHAKKATELLRRQTAEMGAWLRPMFPITFDMNRK